MGNVIFILVIVLAGLGVGIKLMYDNVRHHMQSIASKSWPTVEGVVDYARLNQEKHVDTKTHRHYTNYTPEAQYTYSVNGQTYTSTRIAFGPMHSNSNSLIAQQYLRDYRAGGPVTVYYNPKDPADSTLENRVSGSITLLFIGGIFALIGCGSIPLLISAINNLNK